MTQLVRPTFVEQDRPAWITTSKDNEGNYSNLMFETPALQVESILNKKLLKYYFGIEIMLSSKETAQAEVSYELYFGARIGEEVFIFATYEDGSSIPINFIFLKAACFLKWLRPDPNETIVEPTSDAWVVHDS